MEDAMINIAVRDRNIFFRHGVTSLIQGVMTVSTGNSLFYCNAKLAEIDIFFIEVYNMDSFNYVQHLLTTQKCIIVITTENFTLARLFIKNRDRVIVNDKRNPLIKVIKVIEEAVRLSNRSIARDVVTINQEKKISLFTPVELYIVESLKNGLRIAEIAKRLNLSTKTVYTHKYIARRKIGAKKDHSLVDFFLEKLKEDMTIYCHFDLSDIHGS